MASRIDRMYAGSAMIFLTMMIATAAGDATNTFVADLKLIDSSVPIELVPRRSIMLTTFVRRTLSTLMAECGDEAAWPLVVHGIVGPTLKRMPQGDETVYDLVFDVDIQSQDGDFGRLDVGIEILERDVEEWSDSTSLIAADFTMLSIMPTHILPGCVQRRISNSTRADSISSQDASQSAAEANKIPVGHTEASATARRMRKTAEKLAATQTSSPTMTLSEVQKRTVAKHGSAVVAMLNAASAFEYQASHSAFKTRNYAVVGSHLRVGGHEFHMGLKKDPNEKSMAADRLIPTHREALYSGSLPANFDPFAGSDCVANFPARNQASCGSCYAFAASTALSLSFCHALKTHGTIQLSPSSGLHAPSATCRTRTPRLRRTC